MRAPLAAPRASMPHADAALSATHTLCSLVVAVAVSVVVAVVSILGLISLRSPVARLASGAAGR